MLLWVHAPCKLCVEKSNTQPSLTRFVTMQSMFFSSSLVIPRTSVFRSAAQNSSSSADGGLSTSSLSRISRWKHSKLFPGFCACFFISVKVRVPQRTVSSCWILALFHWDMGDCYPLDRLAVTFSLSPSLCLQVVQLITVLFFHVKQFLCVSCFLIKQMIFLLIWLVHSLYFFPW